MAYERIGHDDILARAQRLFRINGFISTSMQDVAGVCGIQKASLYYHFENKEKLATEVLARVQNYFNEFVFAPAYNETLSPLLRMQQVVNATERYFFEGEGGCLVGNFALETIDSTPQFVEPIKSYFNSWSRALAQILSHVYPTKEAWSEAEQYVAEIQGAIMMMRVYRRRDFLQRVHQRMIARLQQA